MVVAFVVLSILLVPIALLLTNVLGQSATARDKLTALSLAEQCLEKLNNTGPKLTQGVPETGVAIAEDETCFSTSTPTTAVTESTTKYEVHAEFTWETAQGSHPDLCTSTVTATLIEAQVWTTWGTTEKVTDTTLLNYPPPGLPNDGYLAVVVNGTPEGSPPTDASGRSWSTRVQLVPVTISRSGFSLTLYPNSYGCVFAEVPAPDTYTVTASNPTIGGKAASPAWTSATETATTSAGTETVNLDTVTHVTLRYDEGMVVSLHYPSTTATEGPATCPAAGQVECVVFGQAPSSSTTPAKVPDAELSVLDTTTKKWSVTLPSGADRLAALACAGTNQCVAVGYGGTAGAYTAKSLSSGTSSTPSFSSDTVPSGVTSLSGITCPASTRCFAWGLSSSGAVILTGTVTSTSVTWGSSVDTIPTTATYAASHVTSIACWSKTRCYALGTKKTATTPVVLSLSTTTSRKWTADTLPSTVTALSQLLCPAATKCYAVGKTSTAGAWVSLASTGKKLTKLTPPTTVTALTQLACPSGKICYATGTRKTGTSTDGAIVSLTTKTTKLDTPKTDASVTSITCPSTAACLAMGTSSSGGPVLLWRTTAATTFTSETLPSSPSTVATLSAITCASSTQCFASGTSSAGSGVVLSGTATWKFDTLETATPIPVSLSGLACGGTVCAVPGATKTAAVYFDGTSTGTKWNNATPSGAKGMYIGGVPIAVTTTGLATTPVEVTVPSGTAAATKTPSLFPFSSGYSVAATECKPLPDSVVVDSTPGATPTETMPMGLVTLRVVNKYGNPDTGATVTAALVTSASCTELGAPTGKTNPASFTLEPTGPLGISQVDVPYGTYNLTVTHSTHSTTIDKVTVNPTSVEKTGGSAQAPWVPLVVTVT